VPLRRCGAAWRELPTNVTIPTSAGRRAGKNSYQARPRGRPYLALRGRNPLRAESLPMLLLVGELFEPEPANRYPLFSPGLARDPTGLHFPNLSLCGVIPRVLLLRADWAP
jgi:hypothetical protein